MFALRSIKWCSPNGTFGMSRGQFTASRPQQAGREEQAEPGMEGQDQGGVRGGLGPAHAVVGAGEEERSAAPQPRAARLLWSLLARTARGTAAASSSAAAGSLLRASVIVHLRQIAARLVMDALGWWLACSCVTLPIVAGIGSRVAGRASLMPSRRWRRPGGTKDR